MSEIRNALDNAGIPIVRSFEAMELRFTQKLASLQGQIDALKSEHCDHGAVGDVRFAIPEGLWAVLDAAVAWNAAYTNRDDDWDYATHASRQRLDLMDAVQAAQKAGLL